MTLLLRRFAMAALLAASCSGAALAEQPQGLHLKMAMSDALAPPEHAWDLHLALGVIPGALGGVPSGGPIFMVPASFESGVTLPMAALEAKLAQAASIGWSELLPGKPTIAPWNTRLVRVSAFAHDTKSDRIVMGGKFAAKGGTSAVLAYFDRPCTIKGVNVEHGVDYRLSIPAAGLYWLRFDQSRSGNYLVRTAGPAFAVQFQAHRPR